MYPYQNPNLPVSERVEDLLSRMTLREKIAQLDMKFGSNYCTEPGKNCGDRSKGCVGYIIL